MAKHSVQPGAVIDGFTIGECVHSGGMATLWSVTRPDIADAAADEDPEGIRGRGSRRHRQFRDGADDPAAAVGTACAGLLRHRRFHAPGLCRDRGIPGNTLYSRLGELPLPYEEASAIARKNRNRACRPAPAERHPSRYQAEQHHVSPLGRSRADRFRAVASQPVARSAAGGVPGSLRHRALHGAGAVARGARRSAQRSVFAGRAAVFLHHRRAAVRRERNPGAACGGGCGAIPIRRAS